MAMTITLQNTVNWSLPYIKNQPLQISNMEPALTIGNMVLGLMIGPPMRWPFNRSSVAVNLIQGQQDTVVNLPTYGFLEGGTITDPAGGDTMPLQPRLYLQKGGKVQGRPTEIAAQYDDGNGNITFRTKEVPGKNYTAALEFQRKCTLLQSLGSVWGPVSDEFSFIYDWGYLTMAGLLVNDARAPIFEKYFIGKLLGTQDGIDDQTRNIFLDNWQMMRRTIQRSDNMTTQGAAGRNV